ncbi:MAG: DUF2807 domain-containing protein [Tannerellaceae bacterium]|nr:DUF2807 domain-containing protein [Tannerellaceae bacterium]
MKNKIVSIGVSLLFSFTISAQAMMGNGNCVTKQIPVSSFNKIEFGEGIYGWNTSGRKKNLNQKSAWPIIRYTQASAALSTIEVTMDWDLFEYLDVSVTEEGCLIIRAGDKPIAPSCMMVKVSSEHLAGVYLHAGADFVTDSPVRSELLRIEAEKESYIRMNQTVSVNFCELLVGGNVNMMLEELNCTDIKLGLFGSARVQLKGKAEKGIFNAQGPAVVKADKFVIENLTVSAKQGSELYVNVTNTLSGRSESSKVRFKKGIQHLQWSEQ